MSDRYVLRYVRVGSGVVLEYAICYEHEDAACQEEGVEGSLEWSHLLQYRTPGVTTSRLCRLLQHSLQPSQSNLLDA